MEPITEKNGNEHQLRKNREDVVALKENNYAFVPAEEIRNIEQIVKNLEEIKQWLKSQKD